MLHFAPEIKILIIENIDKVTKLINKFNEIYKFLIQKRK